MVQHRLLHIAVNIYKYLVFFLDIRHNYVDIHSHEHRKADKQQAHEQYKEARHGHHRILEIVTWLLTGRWLAKRTFRKMAGAAKRHWLALTGTTLAVFLTLLPLCVLISMPLIVLILAQWESQSSTLMGDPIGMPSYMPYLIGVVWFLTMFIQICIRLFIVFACYYTYGSAETRRKERTQQKLSIQ